MTERWSRRVAGVLAAVVVASACSTAGGDVDAPTDAEPTADLVAAGEPLYQASCAQCHGTDLRGTSLGPSHLSIVYEPNHHGDAAFVLAAKPGCASITGDSATCRRSQDSQTVTSTRSWRTSEISRASMDSNHIRRRGTRLPVRPVAIAHLNRKTRPWTRGIDNRLILRCGRALGCDLGSVPISVSGSRPLPSPGGDGLGCPQE